MQRKWKTKKSYIQGECRHFEHGEFWIANRNLLFTPKGELIVLNNPDDPNNTINPCDIIQEFNLGKNYIQVGDLRFKEEKGDLSIEYKFLPYESKYEALAKAIIERRAPKEIKEVLQKKYGGVISYKDFYHGHPIADPQHVDQMYILYHTYERVRPSQKAINDNLERVSTKRASESESALVRKVFVDKAAQVHFNEAITKLKEAYTYSTLAVERAVDRFKEGVSAISKSGDTASSDSNESIGSFHTLAARFRSEMAPYNNNSRRNLLITRVIIAAFTLLGAVLGSTLTPAGTTAGAALDYTAGAAIAGLLLGLFANKIRTCSNPKNGGELITAVIDKGRLILNDSVKH